ncbi:protein kinase [Angomonas deanei]|nr:protein kinase [Angomonas deanei]|eukprot:EPY26702.1 protein kinase [Angomonas deanei]
MERAILTGKKGEMVAHEKEILRRTCHPNIVTLYETIQTPEKVYFALDLMQEDLFEFIVRNKRVNEVLTRKIMYYILSGIHYLHEQSVIHRDIKPENILINTRYNSRGNISDEEAERRLSQAKNINDLDPNDVEVEVKLADFGLAKLVMEWDVRSTPCGTSFYIAPEVIRGIESQGAKPLCTNQRLVKSIDVWSAGVVFFVLLSGRPPFHGQVKTGEERRALLKRIDHGVLFNSNHGWDNVSNEAKDLIVAMLQQDVGQRISAEETLRHPFFTQHGFTRPVPGGDPLARQREQARYLREAQQKQQQQQQQQAVLSENETSSTSLEGSRRKKRNIFDNMKHFFGSSHKTEKGPEEKLMHEELNELQQDVVAKEDAEGGGDLLSYEYAD